MAANVNVGYVRYKNPCTYTKFLHFENFQCLMPRGGFMDIIGALQQEETKLQRQLTAVQGAIAVLNGGPKTVPSPGHTGSSNGTRRKSAMSAAARARISRATRTRWEKFRAEKTKKAKQ
jgi:hypothetical protein